MTQPCMDRNARSNPSMQSSCFFSLSRSCSTSRPAVSSPRRSSKDARSKALRSHEFNIFTLVTDRIFCFGSHQPLASLFCDKGLPSGINLSTLSRKARRLCRSRRRRLIWKRADRADDLTLATKERRATVMMCGQHCAALLQKPGYLAKNFILIHVPSPSSHIRLNTTI